MYKSKKQGSRGMAYLRGSSNYVWSTTCILGRGATATVYQGVNKKTGDLVAVKTFNKLSLDRPLNVQMREFDVLKKVNHENIVKLIAIEDDLESASKVLVMELCTGGSLFTILDDPMNSYGLEEEEFLLVLKDLTAGMKHLRDNNIIHRDLKPGNIMKYVSEDGRSIYKLTDFGAARELEEDQQFMSLYGTEEYLHPAMYERAVLRKPGDKLFSSNVDLWSIGVTLYHVATGNLPFRPYGGRRNRDAMYFITTKKESGVISGVQKDHTTSSIEWSRDLPKQCLLSSGLKDMFVPILAGIMECDSAKMWTFDKFFNEVTRILSAKRLHVFYVNECKESTLYLTHKNLPHSMSDVSESVFKNIGVLGKNQMIFYDRQLLDTYIPEYALPETTLEDPVYLFNTENRDIRLNVTQAYQSIKYPDFSVSLNLDEDASTAKTRCSVSHATKRLIERLTRYHSHLSKAPLQLSLHIEQMTQQLKKQLQMSKSSCGSLERQIGLLAKCESHVADLAGLVPAPCIELDRIRRLITGRQQNITSISESLTRAEMEINALEGKTLSGKPLQKIWNLRKSECGDLVGADQTAATYVNKIRENWQALARDKVAKTLSYHDEQFHVLEKHKMEQTNARLINLLTEKSMKTTHKLAQKLQSWFRDTILLYKQATKLGLAMSTFGDMQQWYSQAVQTEEEFDEQVTQFINMLKSYSSAGMNNNYFNSTSVPGKGKTSRTLLLELQELKRQQHEILQIVEDSQEIMYRVMNISPGSSSGSNGSA